MQHERPSILTHRDSASSWKEGDLGLSLPFHNPHIKNFQIPLGIHNPKLPAMRINANATNLSILPTILDFFVHSDSGSSEEGKEFLKALLPMYEGQSLIRPMNYEGISREGKARKPLNYGLLNPGRGHITVFSPEPSVHWRLTMPLCHPGTFTASNVLEDSNEMTPVRTVSLERVIDEVRERWGSEAADWFAEAGPRAGEWIREISRRWAIDQSSLPGSMVRFWTAE